MFSQHNGAAVHGLRLQSLLIAAMLTAAMAMVTPTGSGHQLLPPGNHKLCGPALSDAMDVVCPHGFNTLPRKRESLLGNSDDAAMTSKPAPCTPRQDKGLNLISKSEPRRETAAWKTLISVWLFINNAVRQFSFQL